MQEFIYVLDNKKLIQVYLNKHIFQKYSNNLHIKYILSQNKQIASNWETSMWEASKQEI